MTDGIDHREVAPDAYRGLRSVDDFLDAADVDPALVEYVKLRSSQLNGCAYCVDLHTRKLGELDENDRKVAAVAAWGEAPFFSDRERSALALAEALTRMGCERLDESIVEAARDRFPEETFVAIVMAIAQINALNRLWVTFGVPEIPDL